MYDQKKLARLKKMEALAPEVMRTFWAFDRAAGATEAELVEAGMVAAALRAGAAVTHTTHTLFSANSPE